MPHVRTRHAERPTARRTQAVRGWGVVVLALALVATGSDRAAAQIDPFGSSPANAAARPGGPRVDPNRKATSGLSEFATDEVVAEIQVKGNQTVPASRITAQMQTRVGRPFDPRALAADIKKLAALPYFVTVRPLHRSTEAGRVIVLEVVERRTLRYVEYLGNESIKDKKLAEATGLAVGGAVDPYGVEEGKRKIEALYRENGFGRVHVEVVEGSKSSDQGVVYSVNEGQKEKVWAVEFEGNVFASDGQLKNKIESKPSPLRLGLIGGKLKRDSLETDVEKLTSYYRSFGFFRAKIGRTVELDEDGEWATVRFAINEGPRYSVRNVAVNGVTVFTEPDVRAGLKLGGDMPFEQATMQTDLGWLRDLYGSRGYVFADIKAETLFLEEPGKIDLVYNIEEGERWRVGRVLVNIKGEQSQTRQQVAINRLTLAPGDVLDTRKIRDAERRIGASGVFNRNPQTGQVPAISYQPTEDTKRRLAEREKAEQKNRDGVFRGQNAGMGSPTAPYPATRYPTTPAFAPPAAPTSVYQVQQSHASSPEAALATSGTPFADPGNPAQRVYGASTAPGAEYDPGPFGGTAVGATDPSVAPVAPFGYGEAPGGVAPAQYAQGYPTTSPYPSTGYPGAAPQPYAALQPPAPQAGYAQPAPPAASYPAATIAPRTFGQTNPVYGSVAADAYQSMAPVNTQIFPSQEYAAGTQPPPNDPFADVVIDLEQTQTGRFMIGVAVNSDAGVVGQISLDEQDFDWRRYPRSMQDVYDGTAFRGGGQRFRLEAAPGTEVQRYLASWQEPYLLDSPISLNLSGSYFDRRYDHWDEQRLGGRVGFGYQWVDRDLSGMLTYRGESVKIHNVADPTLPDYAEMVGENSLHGFGVTLVTDKRDNPFLATDGYYLSGSIEQVVGSFVYPRAQIDARTYLKLRERPDHTGRHVLTLQSRLGWTGSDTPVYDRFFAGGFSTLRGYDFRGASPVTGVSNLEVGGDWMFINTLEYMFPLTADDMIHAVAFIDHGTVTPDVSLDDYRVAPGVGLRITVPAMGPAPIALDFAWPVSGPETDDERVFTFNVGFQR